MNSTEWEEFRIQAIKLVGLDGHPKASETYAQAWKSGYEGGPNEVLIHLYCLAEIVLGDQHAQTRH